MTQDYHELHSWSVANYDLFWEEVWQFTGVIRQADISPSMASSGAPFGGHRVQYIRSRLGGHSVQCTEVV